MVYKVSKGGVRSGNTLRGLNSLKTKRYVSQACLIGSSNLSGKSVDKWLLESIDDNEVKDTLGNTDVLLSLNKRGRWRVPSAVSNMIKAGYFSESNTMVRYLERHKLKRKANCVGFACSKESGGIGLELKNKKTSMLKESQKKYFSYSLDFVDQLESRRKMKKRIAEELKTLARENKLDKMNNSYRTVDVFTIEGRKTNSILNTNPVYNLEVFYPCPQSCSLTYNPKYTDVIMTENDDGEMEIRSNTKTEKKSRKKHRKRFTNSDLAVFNTEIATCEEDIEEMWREEYEDMTKSENAKQNTSTSDKHDQETTSKSMEETAHRYDGRTNRYSLSDSILASLVKEAELARTHLDRACTRTRRRKRPYSIVENTTSERYKYIARPNQDAILPKQPKSESLNSLPKTSDSLPALSSFPIILSSDEVTPENLNERFGTTYSEADCQPRRFCLNITESVRNVMSVSRRLITPMHNTFIIFTNTSIFDDGLDTYDVTVNCAGCPESESISYSIPQGKTTLEKVITTLVGNMLDLKNAGHKNFSSETFKCEQQSLSPVQERTMGKQKIRVETFFTSDELSRLSELGNLQEKETDTQKHSQSLMRVPSENDVEQFCDICYELIDCSQKDTVQATQLNACGHLFCNACWQAHLRTRFREGGVHMVCPGYQCDTKLGPSTLLSLLHVTEVAHILQRACEDEMEVCSTAKWCPSPSCGRVIRLTRMPSENSICDSVPSLALETSLDVTCACGEEWCFSCLSPAHWPAGCEQAQDYLAKAKTFKPRQDTLDPEIEAAPAAAATPPGSEILEVEGRLCPKCRRFINKNGGCPHISCKCGHQFCWTCLLPYPHNICNPNAKTLKAYTRIVKVRHMVQLTHTGFDIATQSEKVTKATKATGNRHQKASMFLKALNQREEAEQDKEKHASTTDLIARICRVISTDVEFKKEILLRCGFPNSTTINWSRTGSVTAKDMIIRQTVVETLTRYLSAIQRSRLALHRVVEYTFVLLQDLPACTEKRRAFRVASDLMACCSFSQSVFQAGGYQDPRTALRRLSEIEIWSNRALDTLLAVVHRLRHSI